MSNLNELTISEVAEKLQQKEVSALDVVRSCKEETEKRNPTLHAYLEVFDDVEEQARAADVRRANGESHPLLGIPLAVKDNILIEGRVASAASKMLQNYTASYDATIIAKLKKAGAVFLGRTNMDEFAMGGSTENSAFGPTKNPLDETRVPGGSSGGSAAAVAAHLSLAALGTDTGGSIREPASFCGLVGLKPTYGALSRSGLIAMGSSLDQSGPLTRSVEDARLLFEAMRGRDPLDSSSSDFEVAKREVRTIGVPRTLFAQGVDADVLQVFEKKLEALRAGGCEVVDIELPSAALALAVYYVLMPAEVSTNLARFDGVRYGLSRKGDSLTDDYAQTRAAGFGPETRRRIMLGTYVLSAGYYDAYYGKALAAREKLRAECAEALQKVDVIATPTTPSPAFKIGEKADPLAMYLLDVFTVTANITGNPAISVPMGTVPREGMQLPVGMQFTAAHGGEGTLFNIGAKVEANMH